MAYHQLAFRQCMLDNHLLAGTEVILLTSPSSYAAVNNAAVIAYHYLPLVNPTLLTVGVGVSTGTLYFNLALPTYPRIAIDFLSYGTNTTFTPTLEADYCSFVYPETDYSFVNKKQFENPIFCEVFSDSPVTMIKLKLEYSGIAAYPQNAVNFFGVYYKMLGKMETK